MLDEGDVGFGAGIVDMDAVLVEVLVVPGGCTVPVNNGDNVGMAFGCAGDGAVGLRLPVARTADVDQDDLLVGADDVENLVDLLVHDGVVRAQAEHDIFADLVVLEVELIRAFPDVAVDDGIAVAVGERAVKLVFAASCDAVTDEQRVEYQRASIVHMLSVEQLVVGILTTLALDFLDGFVNLGVDGLHCMADDSAKIHGRLRALFVGEGFLFRGDGLAYTLDEGLGGFFCCSEYGCGGFALIVGECLGLCGDGGIDALREGLDGFGCVRGPSG